MNPKLATLPKRTGPSTGRLVAIGSMALVVALVFNPAVRADALDAKLLHEAPSILKKLQAKSYHTVAILKFGINKPKQGVTYNDGPINVNLADRLERALVEKNDLKNPINIIQDATTVAYRKLTFKRGDKFDLENDLNDRKAVLGIEYPLVWGNKTYKPDVILIGRVVLSKDFQNAEVILRAFDSKNPKAMFEVDRFSFKTDRVFLAECGQTFVVKRSIQKRSRNTTGGTPDEGDQNAANSANNQTNNGSEDNPSNNPENPIELTIKFNGQAVSMTPDSESSGNSRFNIGEPQETDKVQFVLKNKGTERVAVLLSINGINTLYEEVVKDRPLNECTKWILDPNDEYTIDGFHTGSLGKDLKSFRVLPGDKSKEKWEMDPETQGLINLVVFTQNPTPGQTIKVTEDEIRNLRRRGTGYSSKKPTTAQEARSLFNPAKAPRLMHKNKRGLIEASEETIDVNPLKQVEFTYSPQPQVNWSIR